MLVGWLAAIALIAWVAVLLMPSRSWSTRERLEPADPIPSEALPDLSRVTVLIPARNEADAIEGTLRALSAQGRNLRVVVIDDESDDGTGRVAAESGRALSGGLALEVVAGEPLPAGWGGKLWALEQGLARVGSAYCLLLDAEIRVAPGLIAALLDVAERGDRAMVSIMAKLRCETFWERLLVPPFIFFFKLLYPFASVNSRRRRRAAAAGGCVLVRTDVLREIGAFETIRGALIDDCTLAARMKRAGHAIWLGLSESVTSVRAYPDLAGFRRMVTRTAFTQLGYSGPLLVAVCALMLILFAGPWLAIVAGGGMSVRFGGALAVVAMALTYLPTVRFYRLTPLWVLTLPLAALLYLAMTVESALNYWRGVRAEWKGRKYAAD